MRKRIVSLTLVMVLVFALCVSATAAGANKHEVKALNDKTTVAFKSDAQENLTVEVTGLSDGQYILMVLNATIKDDWSYTSSDIAKENIQYIDQAAAVGGKLTFKNVFPKSITNSVIMISGSSGKQDIALIKAGFMLGDVNGDGQIRANDAMLAAQLAAKMTPAVTVNKAAADVNGDGNIRANDAMLIAQFAAKIISEF